jgi:hypothetical protein
LPLDLPCEPCPQRGSAVQPELLERYSCQFTDAAIAGKQATIPTFQNQTIVQRLNQCLERMSLFAQFFIRKGE